MTRFLFEAYNFLIFNVNLGSLEFAVFQQDPVNDERDF
jgi:hypothetical protein